MASQFSCAATWTPARGGLALNRKRPELTCPLLPPFFPCCLYTRGGLRQQSCRPVLTMPSFWGGAVPAVNPVLLSFSPDQACVNQVSSLMLPIAFFVPFAERRREV